MTKRKFFTLSLIGVLEILIGYGMVFALYGQERMVLFEQQRMDDEPQETPSLLFRPTLPESQPVAMEKEEVPLGSQRAQQPEVLRAVYLTAWSGGSPARIEYIVNLARTTELNAVVIDVKDFSGEIAYATEVPQAKVYGAERVKIGDIEALIKRFHEEGIYVIARLTVFQDPVLARARPDLAVQSTSQESLWADYKGLSWVDPTLKEVWDYTVAIARDVAKRGFDEINFDYVRFPSDGDLRDMRFPVWDGKKPRREVLREFFAYLRQSLEDIVISVDLFGLSTSSTEDLGIGQIIEDAYEYFDYVYPMVYPSHYASGVLGYKNPAEYPYEIVFYSVINAQVRLGALRQAHPQKKFAKLRPWLQDFHLGARYDALMVQAQIQATKDALGEQYSGFLLWSSTNWYTAEALQPFSLDREAYNFRPRTP